MSPSKSRRRRPRKKKSINTKLILTVVAVLVIVVAAIVAYTMLGDNGSSSEVVPTSNKVLLETSMGNITIQLRDDMPITVNNFKNLVQKGAYDNTIFHRVIADFMIQGGDPTTGPWSGGEISTIPDEFSDNDENNRNDRTTVAMANRGANTGSSQFFISVVDNNHLDGVHPVFGDVIDGMDVVDSISEVATSGDPLNKPLEDVRLIKARLID